MVVKKFLLRTILGDPGAVSRIGTKVFKYGRKSPWVPTLTELFPKIQADAGSWLGTKNALYYCAQSANSFSWVLFVSLYTTAIVSIRACLAHAPKKFTQSEDPQFDIKSPSDFCPKTKATFPKIQVWAYTTGIHACIGHVLRMYEGVFKRYQDGWQPRKRRTFFQSLWWLFQLAYFVKCKRTLLELNFY